MPSNNFPYTIVYLTNMRVPTEKAHGLAAAKICEAFVDAGVKLELVAPKIRRAPQADFFDYYGLKRRFPIFLLPACDTLAFGVCKKAAFVADLFSFCVTATLFCVRRYGGSKNRVIFFSHDSVPLWFLSWFFPNIFYDIHHFPGHSFLYKRVLKKARGIAVQTKWKVRALAETFGIDATKIVYWPNGTDAAMFDVREPVGAVRRRLGIPEDKKIVLYTGQLFDWKGVETLISAAPLLPSDAVVYIVGGSEEDVRRIQKAVPAARSPNIRYVPFQPHDAIPLWLYAADVLVLPNTGKQKVSLYYTSPMKLFEYMASGRPIVASDTPSIREILDETTGFFAQPDDPRSFADVIARVLNGKEARAVGEAARREAGRYTWSARAQKIFALMETCMPKHLLRICFLTHNLKQDNGAGVFSRRLIEGARDLFPCDVTALTAVPSGEAYERAILYPERLRLLRALFYIRACLKECDIIHALDAFPYGVIAAAASVGLGKKLIITGVGTGSIRYLYRSGYRMLLAAAYRRADIVTAISRFTRGEILKRVPTIPISVISPGVDDKRFAKADGETTPEEVQKLQPYMLSVGSLRWRKGYAVTIRAFANIARLFPHLQYVIVGKKYTEKEYQKIRSVIREAGLEGRVHLIDTVDDFPTLRAWYRGAKVFGLLSQNEGHDVEGFGLVFLEAAAAGLPVVGSRGCGVEDAMADGVNGYVVDERDGDAFAERVIRILENPALQSRMSKASLEYAKKNAWEEKLKQYVDIYRGIM